MCAALADVTAVSVLLRTALCMRITIRRSTTRGLKFIACNAVAVIVIHPSTVYCFVEHRKLHYIPYQMHNAPYVKHGTAATSSQMPPLCDTSHGCNVENVMRTCISTALL